jgi:hypothetical protein
MAFIVLLAMSNAALQGTTGQVLQCRDELGRSARAARSRLSFDIAPDVRST